MKVRESEDGQEQLAGTGGGWVLPDVSYIDPSRRFCAYCGRPIARRYWAELAESDLAYCDAQHAARHATYPSENQQR